MGKDGKKTRLRVLIVDDSRDIIARVSEKLSSFTDSLSLESATSGDEGLVLFQKRSPDIAIIDMSMPGTSGLELVRKLRRLNAQTQIVILTMLTRDDYESSCLEAGANFFLSKIHDFEKLPELLQDLIDTRS